MNKLAPYSKISPIPQSCPPAAPVGVGNVSMGGCSDYTHSNAKGCIYLNEEFFFTNQSPPVVKINTSYHRDQTLLIQNMTPNVVTFMVSLSENRKETGLVFSIASQQENLLKVEFPGSILYIHCLSKRPELASWGSPCIRVALTMVNLSENQSSLSTFYQTSTHGSSLPDSNADPAKVQTTKPSTACRSLGDRKMSFDDLDRSPNFSIQNEYKAELATEQKRQHSIPPLATSKEKSKEPFSTKNTEKSSNLMDIPSSFYQNPSLNPPFPVKVETETNQKDVTSLWVKQSVPLISPSADSVGVGETAPPPVCDMRSGCGHAHPNDDSANEKEIKVKQDLNHSGFDKGLLLETQNTMDKQELNTLSFVESPTLFSSLSTSSTSSSSTSSSSTSSPSSLLQRVDKTSEVNSNAEGLIFNNQNLICDELYRPNVGGKHLLPANSETQGNRPHFNTCCPFPTSQCNDSVQLSSLGESSVCSGSNYSNSSIEKKLDQELLDHMQKKQSSQISSNNEKLLPLKEKRDLLTTKIQTPHRNSRFQQKEFKSAFIRHLLYPQKWKLAALMCVIGLLGSRLTVLLSS